jgi:pimeloyl-ACP methyl ester carboxylesterase
MQAFVPTSDGARIAVRRVGSGPSLVFLTNWGFSSAVFTHQEAYFSSTHTVYLIEPRGHGASPAHPTGNDYATHASDLAAVFDHFSLERVNIVGWYTGAVTALAYCEQFGTQRLATLTGIDLSPRPMFDDVAAWAVDPLRLIADKFQQLMRSPGTRRLLLEFFLDRFLIDRRLDAAEREWLMAQATASEFDLVRGLLADLMLRNYRSTLQRVAPELPILGIYARHWIEYAHSDIQPIAPQMRFMSFGGSMMYWEYHERFNQQLAAFLAQHAH